MITAADARASRFHQPKWLSWLHRELAPFPGRKEMTIRMVVAVTLVTLISMALQVPQLAFSAFFVFFVTKENRALTLLTGLIMITGATIASAASLLLYRFTFDYPELRVPVIAGFIFTAMFLSRTFVIGPLGFVMGFFSALMQTIGGKRAEYRCAGARHPLALDRHRLSHRPHHFHQSSFVAGRSLGDAGAGIDAAA